MEKKQRTYKRGTGMAKAFEITSVNRDDLVQAGYPAWKVKRLTDSDMKEIAWKLADDYCEQLFWDSLETIVDEHFEYLKHSKNKTP